MMAEPRTSAHFRSVFPDDENWWCDSDSQNCCADSSVSRFCSCPALFSLLLGW